MKVASAKSRVILAVVLAGVLPVLLSVIAHLLFGAARYVHEGLHECLELMGMFIALGVAYLLWFRAQHEKGSDHLLWVAAALMAMGLTDGVHAVAPFGIVWSWLRHGATLVGGLLFATVWLPLPSAIQRRRNVFLGGVAALTMLGILLVAWRPDLFPPPFAAVGYTLTVLAVNALGGCGFVAAALFFLKRYLRQSESEDLVFVSLTLLFGASSLLFGLSHVWAADWWVWHGSRLLAYAILVLTAYKVFRAGEEQRRQLAEAVQAERRRFNDVLNLLPAYVVLLSKGYQVPFANRYFEERFGKSNGRRCYEYLFQRTEPCENCENYTVMKTNAPHHWEWLGPDGRNYDIHDFPFTDQDGSPLIMEMGIDITERKAVEQRLAEQQFYSRSLLEASLDPLVTISREGKITDVNRATESVTGVAREQLIGSDFSDYFSEPEKARAGYQQVFAENFVQDYPLAIRHSSGRITDVLYNATVFKNAAGEVAGVFAAARDITERKRAEEALRNSQQRLSLHVQQTPLAVIEWNLSYEVADWNPRAETLFGYTREEAIGKHSSFIVPDTDRGKVGRVWTELMSKQGGSRSTNLNVTKQGRIITCEWYNTPLVDSTGKVIGVASLAEDITERKQAEEELKRYAAELERSNAELQDFASIASHDLQEPLRKVLAFGEHLKEHLGNNLDNLGSDFLARMQNAAQRMSGLIEALLQYSRVATRAQPIQLVEMTQVVFGVLVDMEERIRQSGARVEFQPMSKVMADPTQVRQLVQNLLGNALKFQPRGRTPHVELNSRQHNGWCEISVRDNGIGFDEKYLDRIFRPFQRLQGRSEYEGSGMGLAICRKVVARHGGTITAHSRPGEGSTFLVTLPTAANTDERRTEWQAKTEMSSFESCSPKTMTTITS